MTQAQIIEAEKALKCLSEARAHLDTAMYRLGVIGKEDYAKLRNFYEAICGAMDMV